MENRRPLSSRDIGFFQKLAKALVNMGLTPNQVSVLSTIFAVVSAIGFYKLSTLTACVLLCWFMALAGILLRLLCNLMDGLMAIEGGKKTPAGEIYNDFPDRLSDVIIMMGASFLVPYSWGRDLGWLASVLALFTAYVRMLSASMGKGHDFCGPMAKQHRMFVLNVSLVAWLAEYYLTSTTYSLTVGLLIIAAGSLVTVINRLCKLVKKL